ncbi:hypothetical protein [Nocardia sp. NPDC058633]|uniref:hypothetical protein n=1 Tax=Nocardia sp. NPDC058633 TaxID=3346568 RepID=UPI003650581E
MPLREMPMMIISVSWVSGEFGQPVLRDRIGCRACSSDVLSQVRVLGRTHKTWATGKRLVIAGHYSI